MPLKSKSVSTNIKEFHQGKTFKATEAAHGKKVADKQAIAVGLNAARKNGNTSVPAPMPVSRKK